MKYPPNDNSNSKKARAAGAWLPLLGKPFKGLLSLGSVCAHHLMLTGPDFPTRKDEEDQVSGGFVGLGREKTTGSRVHGGVPGLGSPPCIAGCLSIGVQALPQSSRESVFMKG